MIENITKIDGFHVYSNGSITTETPRFRQINLIYGFNGTGKSTLSRVLGCQCNQPQVQFHPNEVFTLSIEDSSNISNTDYAKNKNTNTFVFNDEFKSMMIKWDSHSANSIVILGKEQQDTKVKLDSLRKQIASKEDETDGAIVKSREASGAFSGYKTEQARQIAVAIGEERGYRSDSFARDMKSYKPDSIALLDEEKLLGCRKVVRNDDLPKPIAKIGIAKLDLGHAFQICTALNSRTLRNILDNLEPEQGEAISWISKGLELHNKPYLDTCFFCKGKVTRDRLKTLSEYFSTDYDDFLDQIKQYSTHILKQIQILHSFEATLPSPDKFDYSLRSKYLNDLIAIRKSIHELTGGLQGFKTLLNEKNLDLNKKQAQDGLLSDERISQLNQQIVSTTASIQHSVTSHNEIALDYEKHVLKAKEEIKNHHLEKEHSAFSKLEQHSKDSDSTKTKLQDEFDQLRETEQSLVDSMRSHAPAADMINRLIATHVGHNELKLVPGEVGYKLHRSGKQAEAPPSEGEKNAIALSYFLILLRGDDRKISDLTIILDDPASSMDARSLHYTASLIENELSKCHQLFIFTHNMQLMRDLKKWMFRKTSKLTDNPTAELFFLDSQLNQQDEKRLSILCALPKYLRDYDSEYHYLFWVLQQSVILQPSENPYIYMLPNALRKLLDILLAFKDPGPSGFKEKLKAVAQSTGLDTAEILRLEKVVQVESHADSVDSLVDLPAITVEEIYAAMQTTIKIYTNLDEPHYKAMKRKCK